MKILVFGASGMVGQGAVRESLLAPDVSEVIVVVRQTLALSHPKLRQIVVDDVLDLNLHRTQLKDVSGCFFCIGVSSSGMSADAYKKFTHGLTLAVANKLLAINERMVFVYVSGAGADSSERNGRMWARVRGQTENAILRLPFANSFILRPALIQPLHGARSKTRSYRVLYRILAPVLPLLRWIAPGSVLSTQLLGEAMLGLLRRGASVRVLESSEIRALVEQSPPTCPAERESASPCAP
ncbi:epimerase [Massilia niabensis]|uniref:Epimerase n=1 Tax=Massilia niabensis TaxID=544910 RepID=A0ABW0KZT7_9BURK